MKKVITAFISCSLLCFFSCASNSNTSSQLEDDTKSALTSPEETTESEENETTEFENLTDNIEESKLISESFPELEEIVEPEITTLEWTEPEITEIESNETVNLNIEPVITELPTSEETSQIENITQNDEINEIGSEKSDLEIEKENVEINVVENTETEAIIPSRKVTLKKLEYLEITYPGNGWVFMGLTDGSKDLSFFGRKLGTENTKFTLQAKNSGTKILHFYKNDPVKNQYIDDYIEVEILNEKGLTSSHIAAPPYKTAVPKKAKKIIEDKKAEIEVQTNSETTDDTDEVEIVETTVNKTKTETQKQTPKKESPKKETSKPVTKTTKTLTEPEPVKEEPLSKVIIDSNSLLQEAQVLYNEKEYKLAKDKLNQFFESSNDKRDEGLYLQGQILEAKSDIQNIKAAIDSYTTLTKNYPASKFWEAANKRIIYLKRFYLEAR